MDKVEIHVADLPEVVASLRREMAKLLRAAAEDSVSLDDPRKTLRSLADAFEAGLSYQGRQEIG